MSKKEELRQSIREQVREAMIKKFNHSPQKTTNDDEKSVNK